MTSNINYPSFFAPSPLIQIIDNEAIEACGLTPGMIGTDGPIVEAQNWDAGATTPSLLIAEQAMQRLIPFLVNPARSQTTLSSHMAERYAHARETVLTFLHANPTDYVAVYGGAGATSLANLAAQQALVGGGVAFVSGDAHNSLLEPLLKHASHVERLAMDPITGLPSFRDIFSRISAIPESERRLLALTGVSNITGARLPHDFIVQATMLAHQVGMKVMIDLAQGAAHAPFNMDKTDVDIVIASGHKIYAAGSPGFGVFRRNLLRQVPVNVGGGAYKDVTPEGFFLPIGAPGLYEAGTPPFWGAIKLGIAMESLMALGMELVWEHEQGIIIPLSKDLATIGGLKVYGDINAANTERAGVIAFNIEGLDYRIVESALEDYFGIVTRSGYHGAQVFMKDLLGWAEADQKAFHRAIEDGDASLTPGAVRANITLATTPEMVDSFTKALRWIAENRERLAAEYRLDFDLKKGSATVTRFDGKKAQLAGVPSLRPFLRADGTLALG